MPHLIMLLISAAVGAATVGAPHASDAELPLDAVLQRVDGRAEALHSVQAVFTQSDFDPVFEESDESSGVVRLVRSQPGDAEAPPVYQVRFDYMKPERSVTIINGSSVIVWTPEMSAPEESHLIDDTKMQTLLAGFVSTEQLREHYDVRISEQCAHEVTLRLTPTSDEAKRHFRSMAVTFDKRSWLPAQIFHDKLNGQKVTFTFDNIRLDHTVPPEQFTAASLAPLMKKAAQARPGSAAR